MSKKPTFGICAPSSYASQPDLDQGLEKLRALGHELIVHPQAYGRLRDTQLAGTTDEKIMAIYDLMNDPKVDIVIGTKGGQTASHLLDKIDFKKITKPIMGFSDTTALLNAAYAQTGIVQYHGPHAASFRPERYRDEIYTAMIDALNGSISPLALKDTCIQKSGISTGRLIGGNFSLFLHLLHTPWCPHLDGAILFFEDTGEELSSFDRTLNYFRLLGLFDRAAGVIFGQFSKMQDTGRPFGFTVDEIIAAHTASATCPIITNAPFGHTGLLVTYPVGAVATLDACGNQPTLTIRS